jgi:periplasmic divalent cation tolerance protein
MPQNDGEVLVITTVGKPEQAALLAGKLVAESLAACVTTLGGALSFFRWQGQHVREDEVVLLIKTHTSKLADLETCFAQEHPYETPELLEHISKTVDS